MMRQGPGLFRRSSGQGPQHLVSGPVDLHARKGASQVENNRLRLHDIAERRDFNDQDSLYSRCHIAFSDETILLDIFGTEGGKIFLRRANPWLRQVTTLFSHLLDLLERPAKLPGSP